MVDYNELALELMEYIRENSGLKFQRSTEGFTHGEVKILSLLVCSDDGISPGSICKNLKMTTPRISAALSSLAKKGLVTRVTDPCDKRRLHVYITDEGRAFVESKKEDLLDALSELLSTLGEDDALEYVRIMGRIHANASHLTMAD